jgi:hypothetical protein
MRLYKEATKQGTFPISFVPSSSMALIFSSYSWNALSFPYSYFFGRRDENGEPFEYADCAKETIKHAWKYLHD